MEKMRTILHLCADIGSDSLFYKLDENYNVIMVGKKIGVENFSTYEKIHGVIANPVCTEFSTAKGFHKDNNTEKGMFLVNYCLKIINEVDPKWWVLENPANGMLHKIIGRPEYVYQPWQYGSPWTKKTALWGKFNIPKPLYEKWEDVPKNDKLYIRPGRPKPSLAFLHKSAVNHIPEFRWAKEYIKCDADMRSMCPRGFAKAFYDSNK